MRHSTSKFKATFSIAAFFFLCSGITAQDASLVEATYQEYLNADNDSTRSAALSDMAFNLISSDPDSARVVGHKALVIARRVGDEQLIGDAQNSLGWLAVRSGELDKGQQYLDSALMLFEKIDSRSSQCVVLGNLGWLAEKRGDQVETVKYFQDALDIAEELQDSALVAVMLYSIGTTYRKMLEFDPALEFMTMSLEMERSLGRTSKEAHCFMGLANIYLEMGEVEQAREMYDEAEKLYQEIGNRSGVGLVHENMGNMYFERDPQLAIQHYEIAYAHYDTLGSDADKAFMLMGYGRAQAKQGLFTEAESHLEQGLATAKQMGSEGLVMNYMYALAELASQRGDGKETFDRFKLYQEMKDSLQGADTQKELARLRTAFETERKEKDNEILRAQNSEHEKRDRLQNLQLIGSLVIGFLALIAAGLFWRNLVQKRRHVAVLDRLNHELEESNEQIKEINGLLEMKVLRSQMNPHFIYNCLNSAAEMTQSGKNKEALKYLQGFARLLRMVLDHSVMDRITVQDELDFLKQYLELEVYRLDGLEFELKAEDVLIEEDAEIPSLIVQPFVENAVWHGLANKEGKRTVSVEFIEANGQTVCSVRDNGIGRDKAAATQNGDHNSLGMQLTSERLRLLSRKLEEAGSISVQDLKDEKGAATGTQVNVQLGA